MTGPCACTVKPHPLYSYGRRHEFWHFSVDYAPDPDHRLRKLIQGKFSVQVLTSPTTARCNLSPETVQVALDAAMAGFGHLPDDWDEKRGLFIQWLLEELRVSEVTKQSSPLTNVLTRRLTLGGSGLVFLAVTTVTKNFVGPFYDESDSSFLAMSNSMQKFETTLR